MILENFAAFILTNGRPDKIPTYACLRRTGYTGPIYLIVDDLDKTKDKYIEKYGSEVIIFDKKAIAKASDQGDNFDGMCAIIYARNASFEIAKQLGIKYFIQLDDDYSEFKYRFNEKLDYEPKTIRSLDDIFASLVKFFIDTNIASIALSQGGDFIGGAESDMAQSIFLKRKCMNSFICSTERPFKFSGRMNEDVTTYTRLASTGLLLFTTNQVCLTQSATQSVSGGMTEVYLNSGTYVKSFYSVMYHPSSVKVKMLNTHHGVTHNQRLHHKINWTNTVPKILRETQKKVTIND